MTDCFVLLLLAGAGDELQGLKRGIVEMADILAITKADGANREPAALARTAYAGAMHLFPPAADRWSPPVLTTSALEGVGVTDLWAAVLAHQAQSDASGRRLARRREQAVGLDARAGHDRPRPGAELGNRPSRASSPITKLVCRSSKCRPSQPRTKSSSVFSTGADFWHGSCLEMNPIFRGKIDFLGLCEVRNNLLTVLGFARYKTFNR